MTYYEQYLELEEDLKFQGFGVVVDYVKELHADSRSLRQEVEKTRRQRNTLAQVVDDALECAFDDLSYDGGDIQDRCLSLGVTVSTTFDSRIHADYHAVLEDGDEYHEWSDWFTDVMREINKEQDHGNNS